MLSLTTVIRPMTTHPNDVKKTDPVSKYQQYRQSWKSQRAPGEKSHKNLRWQVREQMLYHDEVVEKVTDSFCLIHLQFLMTNQFQMFVWMEEWLGCVWFLYLKCFYFLWSVVFFCEEMAATSQDILFHSVY